MYEPRLYQSKFNKDRFLLFNVKWKETELLIGTDHSSFDKQMSFHCLQRTRKLRESLDLYIEKHSSFLTSHSPVKPLSGASDEIRLMCSAGEYAGTGPMAAVAGLFSEVIGKLLIDDFGCKEVFVENGGDLFIKLDSPLTFSVFAGKSALSEKIAVEIPSGITALCTSSGKIGHSFSYGCADAVTVACDSAPHADALATSFANKIKNCDDISSVLNRYSDYHLIRSLIIICDDKAGIRGDFPVYPV